MIYPSTYNLPLIIKRSDYDFTVRAGSSFDLYCSDSTGTIAHKINDVDTSNFAEIVSIPATASSSGTPGQIAYDISYICVCKSRYMDESGDSDVVGKDKYFSILKVEK